MAEVHRKGQQLGNYRLVRLLGTGGFAEVYLGEHIHLGTQAAIKVLHTRLGRDDTEKFRAEARTIARLLHNNIIRVLEFGVEGSTPFLVMDYAPNGTLRHRHPKGTQIPLTLIIGYIKQVANALQYAHNVRLIHRDIKPENMLLGRNNEVLLSDFGIALAAQSSRDQSTQNMAGTMAYMAPEQIQGKPRPASDQYSLGIVVYEWLCGERPFSGSLTELAGQHITAPPQPLRERVPMVSPAVERVVMIALAKDPHQRFPSMQAFALALDEASQADSLTFVKPSAANPVRPSAFVQNLQQPTFPSSSIKIPPLPANSSIGTPVLPSQPPRSVRFGAQRSPVYSPTSVPTVPTALPLNRLNGEALERPNLYSHSPSASAMVQTPSTPSSAFSKQPNYAFAYSPQLAPFPLPHKRMRRTVAVGVGIGVINFLLIVIIGLALFSVAFNSGFYLIICVSLLLYFLAGFMVGKVVVQRSMGFVAGLIAAGISTCAFNFLGFVFYRIDVIPLIIFLLVGIIGAFLSWFAAWFTTRKHAYYVGGRT